MQFARVANLVVQDSEVARHDLVLENSSGRDVYPVSMVGDDDNCPLQTSKIHNEESYYISSFVGI